MCEAHYIKAFESVSHTIDLPSESCKFFALEILSCPFLKSVLCGSVRAIR